MNINQTIPGALGTIGRPASCALLVLLLFTLCTSRSFAQPETSPEAEAEAKAGEVIDRVDWPAFLARHDLVWNRIPDRWESGAFMGNGLLGANVFLTADGSRIRWHIGRSDVVSRGQRIPVGDLLLNTTGSLEGCNLRLDLWNAELSGTIKTSQGEIGVRAFTHADQLVQVIELRPTAGERDSQLAWEQGMVRAPAGRDPEADVHHPELEVTREGEVNFAVQRLAGGGGHTAAWTDTVQPDGSRLILVSIGFNTQGDAGKQEAADHLRKAASTGLENLTASHRQWWHAFYPASFVSIPDTRLESFYWIQLYKMASGTRADRPILDLMGPWFRTSPWLRIWFNLNMQLTYWPQLVANHLDLGESFMRAFDTHKEALSANARPHSDDSYALGRSAGYDLVRTAGPEIGNLPWALHNYWLQYRFNMDDEMLRDRLFPLLKGSINYFLHLLEEGDDGYLHISQGFSPEYPDQPRVNPDTNYDLSLLRWGCRTLLDICQRLRIDDPLIPRWRHTLENLVPYPTDENGLMVSASMPFAVSHRHYSHLMMIYPLHIMSLEQPEHQDLVTISLNHWMGLESALRGYSFTGASSISALMGRGDDAEMYLNRFLDAERYGVHPNTMYTEAGPVIETPLSGAKSLQDMILTSWGGKIRVFPAIPDSWKDVTFHRLRAEGAFLVSAVRADGKTQFVRIESLAGEPCRLVTDLQDPQGEGAQLHQVAEGEYELDLTKGQAVVLTSGGATADLIIAPVPSQSNRENFYGLNERTPTRE